MQNINQTSTKTQYTNIISLWLLICIGFFLRFYGITEFALQGDEIWHIFVARERNIEDVFYINLTDDGHPILMYFIWHYIIQIFGISALPLRLPSVIFGVMSIPAGYFLGKNIFKTEKAGLFFAFFICFCPLLIQLSQLVRGYSFSFLTSILAINACFAFNKTKNFIHYGLYFIWLFLSLLTEFSTAPVAIFTALFTFKTIFERKNDNRIIFLIWAITHLFLLGYLIGFTYILKDIGNLDYGGNILFPSNYNPSLVNKFFLYFTYIFFNFLDFLYSWNFFPKNLHFFKIVFKFELLLYFVFLVYGIFEAVKNRFFIPIICFFGYLIIIFLFEYFGKIPFDVSRRHISFILVLIPILYLGYKYFIKFRFFSIVLAIIITICYVEAFQNFYDETAIKVTEKQEIQNFLNKNLNKGDVVISDWQSLLAFYNNAKRDKFPNYEIYEKDGIKFYTNANHDKRSDPQLDYIFDINNVFKIAEKSENLDHIWYLTSNNIKKLNKQEGEEIYQYLIPENKKTEANILREKIESEKSIFFKKLLKFSSTKYLVSFDSDKNKYKFIAFKIERKNFKNFFGNKNYVDVRKFLEEIKQENLK